MVDFLPCENLHILGEIWPKTPKIWRFSQGKKSTIFQGKKIFARKRFFFFLLENHFQMVFKRFWAEKKISDFFIVVEIALWKAGFKIMPPPRFSCFETLISTRFFHPFFPKSQGRNPFLPTRFQKISARFARPISFLPTRFQRSALVRCQNPPVFSTRFFHPFFSTCFFPLFFLAKYVAKNCWDFVFNYLFSKNRGALRAPT